MGIRDALAHSKQGRLKALAGNRDRLSDGFLSISDAVFEATIFRLGLDISDWISEPVNEREFILNYLEKNNVLK